MRDPLVETLHTPIPATMGAAQNGIIWHYAKKRTCVLRPGMSPNTAIRGTQNYSAAPACPKCPKMSHWKKDTGAHESVRDGRLAVSLQPLTGCLCPGSLPVPAL